MTEIGQTAAGLDPEFFNLTADLHSFVRMLLKPEEPGDRSDDKALSLAMSVGTQFENLFGMENMIPAVQRLLDIAVLRSRCVAF